MSPNPDDVLLFALIEVAAAAQEWRRTLVPRTSTASNRAVLGLLKSLDALDRVGAIGKVDGTTP